MNGRDLTRLHDEFWRQGYLVLENFFPERMMADYRRAIIDYFAGRDSYSHSEEFRQLSRVQIQMWFPQKKGVTDFDQLEIDSSFNQLTTALIGEGWLRNDCMIMHSPADSCGQSWHQDCLPDDPARFNLNRLVYPHDVTAGGGGEIVVMPGSHRRGQLPPGEPDGSLRGEVALTPAAGTLVMMHGHTWHKVRPVRSARFSLNYRAMPAGVPRHILDVCVYRNMHYKFSAGSVMQQREAGPRRWWQRWLRR